MWYTSTASLWLVLACTRMVSGYLVPIRDTDQLRETCSGMFGGDEAFIEVSFDPQSSGQVSLVIYEWKDVQYLGVDTPENSKTYICTTSAVRSGLCASTQLGGFITSLPENQHLNSTSIYTTPLKFSSSSFPVSSPGSPIEEVDPTDGGGEEIEDEEELSEGKQEDELPVDVDSPSWMDDRKRQWDLIEGITNGVKSAQAGDGTERQEEGGNAVYEVPSYTGPIHYPVPKTGYYCVGIVPVTLLNQRSIPTLSRAIDGRSEREREMGERQASHGEYSGLVLFKSTFDGQLPAAEYPKINFYLALSIVYFAFGCFWGWLCYKNLSELLPMQYYISGTIVFLLLEMLSNFAYYRYINKHGGGPTSLAFLFVIAILNAARNSLSFFLLLIVCMGLSVVTESLGGMGRIRVLTGFHFVFGVMYSVGTVEVELDNAPLWMVLILIFPLALTLTAFLMWIILSLNGTILHLQQRKQRYKLQMFQRLWRILIMAVIAIAAFFVVSSLSLSNRLDEDYAPRNWRYRWILLDGSLGMIYLMVFIAIAWLWRPTRDNVRFAMSQELAQDETEADAEDYEIDTLDSNRHRRLSDEEAGEGDGYSTIESDARSLKTLGSVAGRKREVEDDNVVFAMGEDSDSDSENEDGGRKGYRDVERRMRDEEEQGEGEGLVRGSGSWSKGD